MDESFSSDLRNLRQRLGISQSKAAKQAGISKSTLNSWEAGRNRPSPHLLEKYLKAWELPSSKRFVTILKPDASYGKELMAEGLRGLRLRSGLSQTELARSVGVEQGTVSKWEWKAGQSQMPPDATFDRLLGVLDLVSEELAVLKHFRAVEDHPIWRSIIRCSAPPHPEELFAMIALPADQERLNERDDLLKLLIAVHAAKHRAGGNPAWEGAHLTLANQYCGSLMRAQRNREMRRFSLEVLDRYEAKHNGSIDFQHISVMEILARHRLTWLPNTEAQDIIRLAPEYEAGTRNWLYGIAARIAQENGIIDTTQYAVKKIKDFMHQTDTFGASLSVIAGLLQAIGLFKEALDTLEVFWDKHWKSNIKGDPYALLPYLVEAESLFALGDRMGATSALNAAESELRQSDTQEVYPAACATIQAKISHIMSIIEA